MKIEKYSQNKTLEKYDVIIIGSGISGLCSAALLGMEGKKVLVLEKHFKIGGYTHTFKRKGYEWDVGIHYIGGMHIKKSFSRKLFDKITENNLKWNKTDKIYDRIIFPDKSYDFIAPKGKFIEQIKSYFPEESLNIDNYIEIITSINSAMFKYFASKSLTGVKQFIFGRYLTKDFLKFSDRTTYEALSEITSNQKLIGVLTGQWGDYGLPPKESSFAMHCAIVGHYLDGANYPIGGSRMISESIVPVINKYGGQIFISTGVDSINIENGVSKGIILENGDKIYSDFVISSAGVQNTLNRFLRNEKQLITYRNKLDLIKPSFGHACLYVGFDQSAKDLGISNTNLWIYPSYNHDLNTQNFMKDENSEFPVTYISFPSSKDPTWDNEHPGTATLEAIVPTSFNSVEKWKDKPWKKRGNEYIEYKEKFTQRIISKIYEINPNLKNKISFAELSSPLSTRDMANYEFGELYGADHTPSRFRQDWLRPKTPVKNLYMTGQDITTVGLPSALMSGVLTCSTLLNKNLFKSI